MEGSSINSEIVHAIRRIVNNEIPDIDISELLISHNCSYLLSKSDKKFDADVIIERLINKKQIITSYDNCRNLFLGLNLDGINYAVIKGAVLSCMAYGNPFIKRSADIDILVSKTNVSHVTNRLKENGFIQGKVLNGMIVPYSRKEILFQISTSHQIAPFVKETGSDICPFVTVDINFDVIWGEEAKKTNTEYILAETEETIINEVRLKKLKPENKALHKGKLCMDKSRI